MAGVALGLARNRLEGPVRQAAAALLVVRQSSRGADVTAFTRRAAAPRSLALESESQVMRDLLCECDEHLARHADFPAFQ